MPLPTPSPSPSPDPGRPEPAAWARLELDVVTATGSDAVRFIDNFTTAAVSQFAEGTGGESFFTDARGWVIALATLLRTDRGLIMVTAAGLGDRLRDHLEHYHIREAVEIEHAPGGTATILVTGSGAGEAVAAVAGEPPPAKPFDHRPARIGGAEVRLVRVAGQGPDGFWIEVPAVRAGDLEQRLEGPGCPGPTPPRSRRRESRPATPPRPTFPPRPSRRNSAATPGRSPSQRAATSARRRWPGSTRWATSIASWCCSRSTPPRRPSRRPSGPETGTRAC